MLSHKIEHLRNKMKVHEDFKAPPVVVQVVGENLVSDGDIDYSCIFPKGTPETGTSICMQEWELSKDATRILIRSYSSLGGHSTDVKHGDRWDRYKAKLMLNHRLCTDFIVLDTFEDIDQLSIPGQPLSNASIRARLQKQNPATEKEKQVKGAQERPRDQVTQRIQRMKRTEITQQMVSEEDEQRVQLEERKTEKKKPERRVRVTSE